MLTPQSLSQTPNATPIPTPPALSSQVQRNFTSQVYGARQQSIAGQSVGEAALPNFAYPGNASLVPCDSRSVTFPNALTQAFSIKSFREHKDLVHRSSTMTSETLSALFPPDLIKSASTMALPPDPNASSFQGLLKNVAATVIQSVWRRYVARCLIASIRVDHKHRIQQMHEENLFTHHVLTSQAAVRRYLALRRTSQVRLQRQGEQDFANRSYETPLRTGGDGGATPRDDDVHEDTFVIPLGNISADDLPPGSVFDADGNRIGGERADGEFAKEMAAVVIQRRVKKHVAERFAFLRKELNKKRLSLGNVPFDEDGRPIGGLSRKYSAAESVVTLSRMFSDKTSSGGRGANKGAVPAPPPPSLQVIHRAFSRAGLNSGIGSVRPTKLGLSQGSGLAAVFWDAGGLLLNPRLPSFSSFHLWGLRILHDVAMTKRKENAEVLVNLPLTIWVQGPLESEAERSRRATRPRRCPTGDASSDAITFSSPSGRSISISRSITPRSGRRGMTGSALRRLSPLGGPCTISPRRQQPSADMQL